MRAWVQKRAVVDGIITTVVVAILVLMAASNSVARTARISHNRSTAVLKPASETAAQQSTAQVLQRQNEILAGLQVSQSALDKAVNDSSMAIHQGLNQLNAGLADSRRESLQTLEATNQRLTSIRRWLEFVALLFVLSLGTVVYFIVRLVRFQEDSVQVQGQHESAISRERRRYSWHSEDPVNGPDPV